MHLPRPRPLAAGLLAAVAAVAACAGSPPATEPPVMGGGPTPHTRRLAPDAPAPADPAADLDAVAALMTGRWVGEAFGGVVEETWNPLLGGAMLGTFRLVSDGQLVFSEHMTLGIEEGRVVMRLKHFHPGLRGWEEKDDSVTFPLVAVDGATAWFSGLTLHRSGDALLGYLAISRGGAVEEEVFRFASAPLEAVPLAGAR